MYMDRYEQITQTALSGEPLADNLINALTDRLRKEELTTNHYRDRKNELDNEVTQLEGKYLRGKHEKERSEDRIKQLWERLEKAQENKSKMNKPNTESTTDMKKQDGLSVTREWCPDQGGGRCVKGGPFFSMAKNGKTWQIK